MRRGRLSKKPLTYRVTRRSLLSQRPPTASASPQGLMSCRSRDRKASAALARSLSSQSLRGASGSRTHGFERKYEFKPYWLGHLHRRYGMRERERVQASVLWWGPEPSVGEDFSETGGWSIQQTVSASSMTQSSRRRSLRRTTRVVKRRGMNCRRYAYGFPPASPAFVGRLLGALPLRRLPRFAFTSSA